MPSMKRFLLFFTEMLYFLFNFFFQCTTGKNLCACPAWSPAQSRCDHIKLQPSSAHENTFVLSYGEQWRKLLKVAHSGPCLQLYFCCSTNSTYWQRVELWFHSDPLLFSFSASVWTDKLNAIVATNIYVGVNILHKAFALMFLNTEYVTSLTNKTRNQCVHPLARSKALLLNLWSFY